MQRTLTPEFAVEVGRLLESINLKYDYDFRHYSPASVERNLVHAMNRMGCRTLPLLQEKILGDSVCFYELVQSLTIPVSEMFRDPRYFLALRKEVAPLLRTYPSIKVWVAGCSTGEEAYSLAILLEEEGLLERTTLYATDINPRSLEKGEKGIFSLESLERSAPNYLHSGGKRLLSDYYTAAAGDAKFDDRLGAKITFADHSLATDSVFSETHLISCRNVLLYFNRTLQDRVIGLFSDSLCRKGFLGLGSQETLQFSQYAKNFADLVKKDRLFQRK